MFVILIWEITAKYNWLLMIIHTRVDGNGKPVPSTTQNCCTSALLHRINVHAVLSVKAVMCNNCMTRFVVHLCDVQTFSALQTTLVGTSDRLCYSYM